MVRNEFEALTASEAQHWALSGSHQVELLDEAVFGEPPEAEAEDVPGATLYIRVPATLKAQLDNAAAADKLSLNAWMMRCAENCLASRRAKLEVVE